MFAFHLWPGGKEIGQKFRRLLDDAPLRHSKNLARQARCAFATQQPDRQNGRSHNYWTAVDELLESVNWPVCRSAAAIACHASWRSLTTSSRSAVPITHTVAL